MRILILGINYAPEPVGIGPYTAGMAEALAAAGHKVEMVAALPYYPQWRTPDAFRSKLPRHSVEAGVSITRVPIYVPARPNGMRRVLHHLSFLLSATLPALRAARRHRPEMVLTIAPSMMSAPLARLAARFAGARSWLHIQDFEVGAAFATGLLDKTSLLGKFAGLFEKLAYRGFDQWSSISPQMCERLEGMGFPPERIYQFRNWADVDRVRPSDGVNGYRAEWDIDTPHVALYSGNISNKQGIGIILEAAEQLKARRDLTFVICGDGPQRAQLEEAAARLPNVMIRPLQPMERLSELVNLATIHLLPQLAGAADLVLPSKLTNMLASGRAVVATADAGTGLAGEVEGCGIVTRPGDADAFAQAIADLLDDPERREKLGRLARERAESHWSKTVILSKMMALLESRVTASDAA